MKYKTHVPPSPLKNLFIYYLRKRHENAINELEGNQDSIKDSLNKLQQQLQQAKVKMAAKA